MWDFVSQKILKHRSYFVFSSNVLLGIIVCNSPYRGVYIMLLRTVIKNDSLSTLTIHHYPAVNLNSLHLIFFFLFPSRFSTLLFCLYQKKKKKVQVWGQIQLIVFQIEMQFTHIGFQHLSRCGFQVKSNL